MRDLLDVLADGSSDGIENIDAILESPTVAREVIVALAKRVQKLERDFADVQGWARSGIPALIPLEKLNIDAITDKVSGEVMMRIATNINVPPYQR